MLTCGKLKIKNSGIINKQKKLYNENTITKIIIFYISIYELYIKKGSIM